MSPSVRRTSVHAALASTLAAVALAGCGGAPAGEPAAAPAPAPAAAAQAPASTQAALTVTDPWVKAADSGMTAVFGTFTTTGTTPVTVVSATTSASPRTELHEVTTEQDGSMVMQPKDGGFVVEPGSPHALGPGGDHIMIMDMAAPIRPGDAVDVTLTLDDGSTVGFSALAKETTAGEENYEHGGDGAAPGGMPGMAGAAPAGQGG